MDIGERYRKQTLRNRALLASPSGKVSFSIPVEKFGYPLPPVSEIRISEHGDWRHKLDHALKSAYGTTPFWSHYEEELRSLIFDESEKSLVGYNALWLDWLCRKWSLPKTVCFDRPDEIGGACFTASLEALSQLPMKRYWQVFEAKVGFISGLSSLDLLLSEGPYAILYLQELATEARRCLRITAP